MDFKNISTHDVTVNPFDLWDKQWLLLTCGNFEDDRFNSMTVAWGSFGTMWKRPFAQIVVRPNRYTYEFTTQYDDFTLCTFPESHRAALKYMGSHSGRDGDKVGPAGITPIASQNVKSPAYAEAELIFECRKMYWDDMRSDNFLYPEIDKLYPQKAYHRVYFGEVVNVLKKSEA
ncbi:MAG: flavin reductase [candidate division KSB1 bacterium]|nr:flavin reductase [candidate division KSB1 bacterium]